jgi:hypothetical protein
MVGNAGVVIVVMVIVVAMRPSVVKHPKKEHDNKHVHNYGLDWMLFCRFVSLPAADALNRVTGKP